MSKIQRDLTFVSGSSYNLNIYLTEQFTLIGVFNSDLDSSPEQVYSDVSNIVSGLTADRLSEIKTFDRNYPYKLNINGVSKIDYTPDGKYSKIYYTINGIDYITDILNSNNTTYSYIARGIDSIIGETFSLIKSDRLLHLNELPQVSNNISIEREQISVFDPHYRTANIKNMGDFLTYGGGNYFEIFE